MRYLEDKLFVRSELESVFLYNRLEKVVDPRFLKQYTHTLDFISSSLYGSGLEGEKN